MLPDSRRAHVWNQPPLTWTTPPGSSSTVDVVEVAVGSETGAGVAVGVGSTAGGGVGSAVGVGVGVGVGGAWVWVWVWVGAWVSVVAWALPLAWLSGQGWATVLRSQSILFLPAMVSRPPRLVLREKAVLWPQPSSRFLVRREPAPHRRRTPRQLAQPQPRTRPWP